MGAVCMPVSTRRIGSLLGCCCAAAVGGGVPGGWVTGAGVWDRGGCCPPAGPIPGGGSILAAVATAAGVEPVVAGKPHPPMADLVRNRLHGDLDGSVVVGDRPSTDGLLAAALGVRFALVLSGVTKADDLPVEPDPAEIASDLASLVN